MADSLIMTHLDALTAFPDELKQTLRGLSDDALRHRPAAGAWSAIETVGHIMEVEALWAGRFRQMLAAEQPVFSAYNPDEAVQQRDYQNKQPAGLLLAFTEQRAELVVFLRILRPAQLARTGVHARHGVISVADGIAILANHDRAHNQQIAAAIEAHQLA
jgi:uncharacterized damage-inducible protein DinB